MKIIAKFLASTLVLLPAIACAGIFEKPIHTKFKNTPIEENIVSGYVQFGTLTNGANAIQAISRVKARFYVRNAMTTFENYLVKEIDCATGYSQIVGFGNLEKSKAAPNPPPAGNVKDMNPNDLSVYREVCTSAGIKPNW